MASSITLSPLPTQEPVQQPSIAYSPLEITLIDIQDRLYTLCQAIQKSNTSEMERQIHELIEVNKQFREEIDKDKSATLLHQTFVYLSTALSLILGAYLLFTGAGTGVGAAMLVSATFTILSELLRETEIISSYISAENQQSLELVLAIIGFIFALGAMYWAALSPRHVDQVASSIQCLAEGGTKLSVSMKDKHKQEQEARRLNHQVKTEHLEQSLSLGQQNQKQLNKSLAQTAETGCALVDKLIYTKELPGA